MQANQLEHEADEFCKIINEIASEPDDANRLVLEKALAEKSETAHILQVGTYIVLNEKYQSLASVTAVIMKSFIKRKVLAKDATNYEQQAEIIKHLAQILESPKAAFDSKRIIAEIVTLIIQKSPTVQSEEHLSGACFHLAFDLFQKGTKNSFLAGLMIILSNLEGGFKEAKRIGNLYRALSPNLLMCGTKSLNHLEPEFASWVQTGKFDIAELTASALIFQYYTDIWKRMLEHLMEFSAHSFLRDLLVGGNSAVVETMRRILVLKSLFKQQLNILGLTNDGAFNQAFNNCKSHALKFFKKAHNYIRAKQSKGKDQESYISQLEARPFYGQMLQVVAPESIDSLYQFYIDKETDLQEIVENESLNDVVIQILRLIEHMVQFQDYFELFSKIDKRLFLDVIMTNFMMLDMHQSNFTDNPQEFCEEFYDLCYTQQSEPSIRSMSMKVTEGFIRRIDGFSNFTITILTNVIHASLNSVDIASIPTIYPELAQITEKKFFKNALNVENRVDTCLVALSGLSYEYAQSTERFATLRQFLLSENQHLLSTTPLLKTRLFSIFAYLLDSLMSLEQSKSTAIDWLREILKVLGQPEQFPDAVGYMALKCLTSIINLKKLHEKVPEVSRELILCIIPFLQHSEYEQSFDIALNFFTTPAKAVFNNDPELFYSLFTALRDRILQELTKPTISKRHKLQHDDDSRKRILYKSWNVVRAICLDKNLMNAYLPKVDELLLLTLIPLEGEQVLGYEDDVVEILQSTIKITGQLAPNLSKVILLFPLIATKFGNKITQLAQTYCILMTKVPSVFDTPAVLENMLTIAANSAKLSDDPRQPETSVSGSIIDLFKVEGILLFIMIIEHLKDKLTEVHWRSIFDVVIEQLSHMEKNRKYYNSRLLGVFMAALYYKPLVAIVYLVNTNYMDKIVELAIKNSTFFMTPTDKKLLILGLLSLFAAKVEQKQFDRLAYECLDCILHLLQIQRVEQNLKAGNYNKKDLQTDEEKEDIDQYEEAQRRLHKLSEGQLHFQDPEDLEEDEEFDFSGSDEDDDQYMFMNEKRRAKESLSHFDLGANRIDEFQLFQETIRKYKESYGEKHFKDIQTEFSPLSKKLLCNALMSRKVPSKPGVPEAAMPRKILKIKGREPNAA